MNKKKIIFFHPYSVIGGADLSISKLINSVPKDYDIEFLTISKKPKIKIYTKKKFTVSKLRYSRLLFSFFSLRRKYLEQLNFYEKVIVISNQNFANIISIFATVNINKIKLILFERNHISELDYSYDFKSFIKNQILKILVKFLYKYSDLVIANSFELSKDLGKFIGKKVETLQNFYNFKNIKTKSNRKLEKNIQFKKNLIINVGRLVNQKNQILLLNSFKIINQINKKINLLIIGDGIKYKEFKKFIFFHKLNNNVQILSNIKNSLPYIKNSDLYVSTSNYEGFPNVIVEALALNVPVISTKYKSGLSEILLNGKGGKLLDKENPEKLAKEIMKFFKNKKVLQIKTMLAKKKLDRFSQKKGIKNFKKIINSL